MNKLILSTLAHTWILDLDGTIVKHNGYKLDGTDTLLEGAKEFLEDIHEKDMIVFLTSRTDEYKNKTINFLNENKIRYDQSIESSSMLIHNFSSRFLLIPILICNPLGFHH